MKTYDFLRKTYDFLRKTYDFLRKTYRRLYELHTDSDISARLEVSCGAGPHGQPQPFLGTSKAPVRCAVISQDKAQNPYEFIGFLTMLLRIPMNS